MPETSTGYRQIYLHALEKKKADSSVHVFMSISMPELQKIVTFKEPCMHAKKQYQCKRTDKSSFISCEEHRKQLGPLSQIGTKLVIHTCLDQFTKCPIVTFYIIQIYIYTYIHTFFYARIRICNCIFKMQLQDILSRKLTSTRLWLNSIKNSCTATNRDTCKKILNICHNQAKFINQD